MNGLIKYLIQRIVHLGEKVSAGVHEYRRERLRILCTFVHHTAGNVSIATASHPIWNHRKTIKPLLKCTRRPMP